MTVQRENKGKPQHGKEADTTSVGGAIQGLTERITKFDIQSDVLICDLSDIHG